MAASGSGSNSGSSSARRARTSFPAAALVDGLLGFGARAPTQVRLRGAAPTRRRRPRPSGSRLCAPGPPRGRRRRLLGEGLLSTLLGFGATAVASSSLGTASDVLRRLTARVPCGDGPSKKAPMARGARRPRPRRRGGGAVILGFAGPPVGRRSRSSYALGSFASARRRRVGALRRINFGTRGRHS